LEAIKILETVKIDLVFLDINLPDINGIQILKRSKILKHPPTAMVAMTCLSGQTIIDKMRRGGADRCITKPFNIYDIYTIINETASNVKSPPNSA
jgi:CheY-like chemotaxis protein